MSDKLSTYRSGKAPLPKRYFLWPLYGAGFDNLGVENKPIEVDLPEYGPDQLLVRHDACGLCFSDIKVIAQGQSHPRIYKDMKTEPVVLGHEVSMTVVGVGENLRHRYKVGDRLTLETDVFVDGKSYAYGYYFQGALSQYSAIDPRIIFSDHGDNLIKLNPRIGYAESALTEPWACVVAAYRLEYRTSLKSGGKTWIIGAGGAQLYTISAGFDPADHPEHLYLTNVPENFSQWLQARAQDLGIGVTEVPDIDSLPSDFVDDIIMLGADPDLIEKTSPHLNEFGIMAIIAKHPMNRKVSVDVGRVHYHRWVYVGGTNPDIAAAYHQNPVRSTLKPGGKAWFPGAGGPMGRMHVQRAIQFSDGSKTIVCSDVSDYRLEELCNSFAAEAESKGINWVCVNPTDTETYTKIMQPYFEEGFDDIVMLVPVPAVIADAADHLAPGGVLNVFAGVARGTMVELDLSSAYLMNIRVIGHSASLMSDFQVVLEKWEDQQLSPNRSLAAIGSLAAAIDGLKAIKDATIPGKIVIYDHIKDFPLTTLPELKDRLPSVYAKLRNGEWTNEAEDEFLRLMLPD
jgi:L-sorbose 1-phosphate reductase